MQGPVLSSSTVRFGTFKADLQNGLLHRNGIRVKLQEQPFRILALLLERPGQVVTRETIRQTLWPDGTFVDFDGGLNAAMKKLRVALDDDPDRPRFIETIPKRGYRFIAPILKETPEKGDAHESATVAFPRSADGTRAGPCGVHAEFGARHSGWRIAAFSGVFLAALAGIVGYHWYGGVRPAGNAAQAAMRRIPTRQAIAVLGFQNASGKPEDAWLSTALTEMMSTELAAGGKLRLVPGEDVSNLQLSAPW